MADQVLVELHNLVGLLQATQWLVVKGVLRRIKGQVQNMEFGHLPAQHRVVSTKELSFLRNLIKSDRSLRSLGLVLDGLSQIQRLRAWPGGWAGCARLLQPRQALRFGLYRPS